MSNLPQTIANDTTARLNALVEESDNMRHLTSTEIQNLIDEIEKLKKVDAREAYVLRGSVAAICGDVEGVREYFAKALRLTDLGATNYNYWMALGNVGLHSEASKIGRWLLEPQRGSFPSSWQMAASRGQLLEVWGRLPVAIKTYPELSKLDFAPLERAVAVMNAHQLSDESVISVFDLMGEIQREHRVMFAGQLISTCKVMSPPEGEQYLYFTISINKGVEEIHAMNRKLARLIVEKLPSGCFPQGMTASFTKADDSALRAAA